VALAKVVRVDFHPVEQNFLKAYQKDWWDADLVVERRLLGKVKSGTLHVGRSGAGPGSCEFDEAPTVGDLRVVYFYYDGSTYHDLDPTRARQEDPRLRRLLPPTSAK
jgi:hypothetical protein